MAIFGKLVDVFGKLVHSFGKLVKIFAKLVHVFIWILVSRTSKQVSVNWGPLWQPGSRMIPRQMPAVHLWGRSRRRLCGKFAEIPQKIRGNLKNTFLTLHFSLFFVRLFFFVFRFPLLFCAFFLSCPRILGIPRREEPLLFSVWFPLFFFKKSQGWRARGRGLCGKFAESPLQLDVK